jgi:hypothetical protein
VNDQPAEEQPGVTPDGSPVLDKKGNKIPQAAARFYAPVDSDGYRPISSSCKRRMSAYRTDDGFVFRSRHEDCEIAWHVPIRRPSDIEEIKIRFQEEATRLRSNHIMTAVAGSIHPRTAVFGICATASICGHRSASCFI